MHTYRLNKVKITYRNVIQSLTRHCVLVMMHSTISFLYLLLRVHVCRTHTGQSPYKTGQRVDSWSHSCRLIAIHNRSALRTDGFTHTGPSTLSYMSAYEGLAALI